MSEIEEIRREFKYLLNEKILSRDEFNELVEQVQSIVGRENQTLVSSLEKEKEKVSQLEHRLKLISPEEKELRVLRERMKELDQINSGLSEALDGALDDFSKMQIRGLKAECG